VIGVGLAATRLGLQTAGIAAGIAVAALATIALVTTLVPGRTRTTRAAALPVRV
jgi:hypothetical protein